MTTLVVRPDAPHKTLVMGIINITPDSFYDGGRVTSPEAVVRRAEQLLHEGADVLDIGGESSRPGAEPVSPEEEQRRVLPALEALRPLEATISVDTYRAATAREALARGAVMINDITALRHDPEMAEVVSEAGCSCVLMHMQGEPRTMQREPRYQDVVDDICAFFEERLDYAVSQGIAEEAVWLDPGFGFGKTVEHNLMILKRLSEFRRLGRPILIGTSNKSTIGSVLDLPVDDRMEGTAATVAIAIANGADAVRVHDVKAMARVARMTDAIMGRIDYA
jgi:dihydropteroate synthase